MQVKDYVVSKYLLGYSESMSASEITIVVKDDEKRLTKKHLIYETYTVDEHDPILAQCIRETEKEFDGEPTDIQVKISMVVK